MAWTGRGIDIERNALIAFDLLLVLVLGLLLYSISARERHARPGPFDLLLLLLVVSALVADAFALAAIASRIFEFGSTPNRVAALGFNIILLVNLGWSAALYLRFIRARSTFDRLERWQTMYLPVFSIWAVVFPLVFIDVDDLAKAEQFYCDALSLSAGRRFGESGVELLGSPAPIYLLAKRSGTVASTKIYGHLGWRSTTTMMHIR